MRIGIDVRFYGSEARGLGRYNQKLVEKLQEIDNRNQYILFILKKNKKRIRLKNKNFKIVIADYPWYSWQEQLFFSHLINKENLDLMHFPHFNIPCLYKKPFVVTIHDLITHSFSTERNTTRNKIYYFIKKRAYYFIVKRAVKKSKKIITVSNYTKEEILKRYRVPKDKIEVVYEGISFNENKYRKSSQKLEKKNKILYVGSAYPHKNLKVLIKAFNDFKRTKLGKDYDLELVGQKEYFYKKLIKWTKRNRLQKRVNFRGHVSDEKLNNIYNESKLFIFPSLMEGFGLPPIEAISKKVPVLSSCVEPMYEILGNAVFYFNPYDSKDLSRKMYLILKDEKKRTQNLKYSFKYIKKYKWLKMAKKIINIYED